MSRGNTNKGIPVPMIVFAMVLFVIVGIIFAVLLAPERDSAPPSSSLSYAAPPAQEDVPEQVSNDVELAPLPAPVLEEVSPTPEVDATIEEDLPGVISGTVRDVKTGAPIPDIEIVVESGNGSAMTDRSGNFSIEGLRLGTHGVKVRYQQTRYRPSVPLPYLKVELTEEVSEKGGVNFVLETAGLVWGYVTTQDKQPLDGAEVVLCTSDSFMSQAMRQFLTRTRPVRTRTNEEGYYELAGVPLNKEWCVYADSQTHAPQLADPFVLTASNDSARLDINMFGGSRVSGIVVTPKGKPIPGADVVCLPAYGELMTSMSTPKGFRDVHSNEQGEFAIPDLGAGEYQLISRKDGFQVAIAGLPIHPDGQSPISNLRLVLDPVEKGKHRIIGEVLSTAGYPIEGAEVRIEGRSFQSVDTIEEEQLSDSRGKFSFTDLPASTYSMEVQAIGYAPKSVPRVLLDKETRVLMSQSGTVLGVVLRQGSREPVEGATITALFKSSDTPLESDMRMPSAVSDVSGAFSMSLPEGNWMLEGHSGDLTPGRADVSLRMGETVTGIEILLSDTGASISGVVTTSDDSSPQGAVVSLIDFTRASVGSITEMVPVDRQTVGEDGVFVFTNLPASQYNLIAEREGMANGSSGLLELLEGNALGGIELRLSLGGVLRGLVYKDGQPQSNVLVIALNVATGTQENAQTDSSGEYELFNLPTGEYMVTIVGGNTGNPIDIGFSGKSVFVTEGQESRLDFGTGSPLVGSIYPGPTSLAGGMAFLRIPGSQPIAPLGVSFELVELAKHSYLYFGNVDFSGQFQFDSVSPGLYQVEVYFATGLNAPPSYQGVYAGQFEVTAEEEQYLQLNAQL